MPCLIIMNLLTDSKRKEADSGIPNIREVMRET